MSITDNIVDITLIIKNKHYTVNIFDQNLAYNIASLGNYLSTFIYIFKKCQVLSG